jgi:hypothetical protein
VPTIITGDFNLIIQLSDKNNRNINRRHMAAFRNLINNLQLKDLYLHGLRYTWNNEQQAATMVKLDRVLFSQDWDTAFPSCFLQAISSEMSDHCPRPAEQRRRFQTSTQVQVREPWANCFDFLSAWNSVQSQVDPFINLHAKLFATARALTRWSSDFNNDLDLRAAISSKLILRLDQAIDHRQLSEEERQFRAMLKVNCLGISAL